MSSVRDLLSAKKSATIHVIGHSATVLEATQLMNHHSIGALVVLVEGRLVGMFTERDVLRRVVAKELRPAEVRVEDVMTTEVACCSPETSIEEARGVMKNRRIRHLPVLSTGGDLLGLISIGDLNASQATEQESTIHHLHEYLHGRC